MHPGAGLTPSYSVHLIQVHIDGEVKRHGQYLLAQLDQVNTMSLRAEQAKNAKEEESVSKDQIDAETQT